MREVISAVPLTGYRLLLTFENAEKRLYDMSNELTGVFECLKNPSSFNAVRVIYGAPTWYSPKGAQIDICPDALYATSVPQIETDLTNWERH